MKTAHSTDPQADQQLAKLRNMGIKVDDSNLNFPPLALIFDSNKEITVLSNGSIKPEQVPGILSQLAFNLMLDLNGGTP